MRLFKFIVPFLLWLGTICSTSAQRHLTGLQGIELQGGSVNNLKLTGKDNGGYYIGLGYSKYFNSKSYWKISIDMDEKNYLIGRRVVVTQRSFLGLTYYRTIIKDRGGKFYINACFGSLVGYEHINGGKALLEPGLELKADSKILYGLSTGIESELYLSDRLALLIQFRERWLIPSDVVNFRWYLGSGFKWIIK